MVRLGTYLVKKFLPSDLQNKAALITAQTYEYPKVKLRHPGAGRDVVLGLGVTADVIGQIPKAVYPRAVRYHLARIADAGSVPRTARFLVTKSEVAKQVPRALYKCTPSRFGSPHLPHEISRSAE